MQSKRLSQSETGERVFAVILETSDEVVTSLMAFARSNKLAGAQITAIGAFSDAVLNYFDWESKSYLEIPVNEQVEVASLVGDIALSPDGEPALHIHLVLGRRDGSALAGHLGSAHVRPTLEVILTEMPEHLQKVHDPETGLALIRTKGQ